MPSSRISYTNRNNTSLDDVCDLLQITTTKDELGQAIKHEKPFMVFCSKVSITRAEFNSAGQWGHRPEVMFIVDAEGYNNEKSLKYHGEKYNIYKTFSRPNNFTELYCEVKSGD